MSKDKRQVWLTQEEADWIFAMRQARKCAEKQPFDTEEKARKIADLQMAQRASTPDLFTYQCSVCRKWHITSRNEVTTPPKPKPIAADMQKLTPKTDD